jgi:dTDP-4-amino-4,6-dideoxygalactose transaminase
MNPGDDRVIPFPRGLPGTGDASSSDLAAGALKSGWLTQGAEALRLQQTAEALLDRRVVPVAGGSAAMHLSLLALARGDGLEVILPGLTSSALANLVILTGGHPVFADIEAPERPFLDAAHANRLVGVNTRAIVTIHEGGYPAPTTLLGRIAAERDLTTIDDCRAGLGASADERPLGATSDLSIFSFGEAPTGGGLIGCHDAETQRRLEVLRSSIIPTDDECFSHDCADSMANGYRIDEAGAAGAVRELGSLAESLDRRRETARVAAGLLTEAGLTMVEPDPGTEPSWRWLIGLAGSRRERDALLATMRRAGVDALVPAAAFAHPPHNARLPRVELPHTAEFCERALEIVVVPRLGDRLAASL